MPLITVTAPGFICERRVVVERLDMPIERQVVPGSFVWKLVRLPNAHS
jgi:hypothetical protein